MTTDDDLRRRRREELMELLPLTVKTDTKLGLIWIEDANGQTVCDFYCANAGISPTLTDMSPSQFHIFPDARNWAELLVEALNASCPRRRPGALGFLQKLGLIE
jgi:hypothetical protein